MCPKCEARGGRLLPARVLIRCPNGHDVSVTSNTALHRTKQTLQDWFFAVFLIATLKPSISAVQLQAQLGMKRHETAFQMLHKIRSVLVHIDREPLKGEVEIDEAFIGGKEEGRPGRGAERKALVIVAVEVVRYVEVDKNDPNLGKEKKRAGRVRMSIIPNAEGATLISWVEENIACGSVIYTDGWAGYNALSRRGYVHRKELQTYKGVATGHFLPLVHLMISNLKRVLLGTYKGAVRRKHLQAYLNEYTFRFNRRFWRGSAFLRVLQFLANAQEWPEYETLYAAGTDWGWKHPDSTTQRKLVRDIEEGLLAAMAPELAQWYVRNKSKVHATLMQVTEDETLYEQPHCPPVKKAGN